MTPEERAAFIDDPDAAFEEFYLFQAKIPYRAPKELVRMGWNAALVYAEARAKATKQVIPIDDSRVVLDAEI
jgi:hypothetical protein